MIDMKNKEKQEKKPLQKQINEEIQQAEIINRVRKSNI